MPRTLRRRPLPDARSKALEHEKFVADVVQVRDVIEKANMAA